MRESIGTLHFYPRSPCGERRPLGHAGDRATEFLSTLSLRRATAADISARRWVRISIHALLAESDNGSPIRSGHDLNFYPRSPCGERQPGERHASSQQEFLSTLSLRRATSWPHGMTLSCLYFYPRSPCGERQSIGTLRTVSVNFYPRSPCGERLSALDNILKLFAFLSTLSLRRATTLGLVGWLRVLISIHALLAESDGIVNRNSNFNQKFLSTLSLRRATHYDNYNLHCVEISIHALLAESDYHNTIFLTIYRGFLSTLSLRRATDAKH